MNLNGKSAVLVKTKTTNKRKIKKETKIIVRQPTLTKRSK